MTESDREVIIDLSDRISESDPSLWIHAMGEPDCVQYAPEERAKPFWIKDYTTRRKGRTTTQQDLVAKAKKIAKRRKKKGYR